jgi:hypothetical protein
MENQGALSGAQIGLLVECVRLRKPYFLGAISGYSLQVLSCFAPCGLFVSIRGTGAENGLK